MAQLAHGSANDQFYPPTIECIANEGSGEVLKQQGGGSPRRHHCMSVPPLSSRPHLSVGQGPPGTGKTTVIAAAIQSKIAENSSNTIWVVAQPNIAVKNVAEKLVDSGFLDFKLLVSKDFHFDW